MKLIPYWFKTIWTSIFHSFWETVQCDCDIVWLWVTDVNCNCNPLHLSREIVYGFFCHFLLLKSLGFLRTAQVWVNPGLKAIASYIRGKLLTKYPWRHESTTLYKWCLDFADFFQFSETSTSIVDQVRMPTMRWGQGEAIYSSESGTRPLYFGKSSHRNVLFSYRICDRLLMTSDYIETEDWDIGS